MAEIHSIGGAGAPIPTSVSAAGCEGEFWSNMTAPVIANPEAAPQERLAWCWGEMVSLIAVSDLIVCGNNDVTPAAFSAIFQHRLEPIERVMRAALADLENA